MTHACNVSPSLTLPRPFWIGTLATVLRRGAVTRPGFPGCPRRLVWHWRFDANKPEGYEALSQRRLIRKEKLKALSDNRRSRVDRQEPWTVLKSMNISKQLFGL